MSTDIFTEVGTVMVFLFAGMGIATFTLWVINKFLTYLFKTLKLWKILIDFIFEYKQFKQWKNERKRNSLSNV